MNTQASTTTEQITTIFRNPNLVWEEDMVNSLLNALAKVEERKILSDVTRKAIDLKAGWRPGLEFKLQLAS